MVVVTTVGYLPFYGNTVIIDHGGDIKHCTDTISEYLVNKGDTVERDSPSPVGSTEQIHRPSSILK